MVEGRIRSRVLVLAEVVVSIRGEVDGMPRKKQGTLGEEEATR